MKNGIVNELITAMKERIPKGQNLANSLADILYMGKEAVYRRLRGEVAFTIDEVALLSKKLGISIDQIIGNHLSNRVTFDMNLLHSPNTLESYYEIISRYQQIFDYVFFPSHFIHLTNTCLSSAFADGFIRTGK